MDTRKVCSSIIVSRECDLKIQSSKISAFVLMGKLRVVV